MEYHENPLEVSNSALKGGVCSDTSFNKRIFRMPKRLHPAPKGAGFRLFVHKKAQAALEFLMTYGWAVLIVLVAIGALAYFGVLSPDNFLPNKCSFPTGISCVDFEYDIISSVPTLKFVIKNNLGWDVTLVSIFPYDTDPSIPQIGSIFCATDAGGADQLKNSEQSTYIVECDLPLPKGKVRTNLVFTYSKTETNLPHQIKGALTFKVK